MKIKRLGVSAINGTTAKVTFKGAVPAGVDFSNFEINGGLTVSDVKFSSDRKTATITVSSEFTRNQEYTVSVFGVKDADGNEYPETKGSFTWEVAEGVVVALDKTTLEPGETVGLTVKDLAGKDVKDATIKIDSFNTNIVKVDGTTPSTVKITAATDLSGEAEVVVKTTLADGTVLSNTFKVTVKEAVTTVANAGYTLLEDITSAEYANTAAFKNYAEAVTSLVEGANPVKIYAFTETNGNPDTTHINFADSTRVVSSNPAVATAVLVGSDIEVEPLRPGKTTVSVTLKDGSRKSFPVTVTEATQLKTITVSETSIKLSDTNRTETTDFNADGQEGVDAKTVKVTGLNQFNKTEALGEKGKVTVSVNTEGLSLYQSDVNGSFGDEITSADNELTYLANAKDAYFKVVAHKETPVKNAKVTVNYFADKNDAKPTTSKTITVDVTKIDVDSKSSSIDVVAGSEIDANANGVTTFSTINFAKEVYALDSKGNRLELLSELSDDNAPTATIAQAYEDDKYVEIAADNTTIQFKDGDTSNALTYLRAAETIDVVVKADGVTKVMPVTYKNTAIVPNKATVNTNPVSIKLADGVDEITFEDIIFGQLDPEQLVLDDASDLTKNDGNNVVSVKKTAKNAGYKYNQPIVSILGTDGKAFATGANIYGTDVDDTTGSLTGNTWFNEVLKGLTNKTFAADDFEVEFAVANVNGKAINTDEGLKAVVEPAEGKATTFTLVISGVYVKDSVTVEGATGLEDAKPAQKAKHNLLAAPVQLNVSVSK